MRSCWSLFLPPHGSLVCAGVVWFPRPTFPNLLGIVPHFGNHRFQMTFEEGMAVPSHTTAIRVGIQDIKAKHLPIF